MASALNKRQQARNERTLQDLIKSVPGNDTCADCGARNPGWASWSLGIFLCMRCAAIHRKLGTHISKVKSLSMDKWDNAQVDNMKRIGNRESNKTFNPRSVRPQIPIDIDEVDSAMERFIRQKYEQRTFMNDSRPGTRQNTGSTSSVEDKPPPLPPKPTRRFGFGLQKTSGLPRNVTPPISPSIGGFDTSPPRVNKPSRIFGSTVSQSGDGLDAKLATLRDMGFPDEKRNATVLKGLNGNLDRAVEALIRLGEQNPGITGNTAPPPPEKPVNGISVNRTKTAPAATQSMNPFDTLDAVAPIPPAVTQQPQTMSIQTQQLPVYGGSFSQTNTPSTHYGYNPFFAQAQQEQFQQQQHQYTPHQQQQQRMQQNQPYQQQQQPQTQQNLEQSFQGMQIGTQQSQQPLFPNRTGGYHQTHQFQQTNPFQHSFTPPPVPQTQPSQYSYAQQNRYPTPISPTNSGNPFLKSARSQIFHPQQPQPLNPFLQNQPTGSVQTNSNPFQHAQQQHVQQAPSSQSPFSQPQSTQSAQSPFSQPPSNQAAQSPFSQPQSRQPTQSTYQQPQPNQATYQQPPSFPQPTTKSSILALYNYPQLAPQRPAEQVQMPPPPAPSAPTGPAPGTLNPFSGTQAGPASASQNGTAPDNGTRHVSNESVDFAGLMGGRHSPDAFSGLSASFRR